ncbi:MAG: DUF3187 family protein [Proteobacteria bacterium]|nr:DUF3187 family protein [Pseudomonadota bacterium]
MILFSTPKPALLPFRWLPVAVFLFYSCLAHGLTLSDGHPLTVGPQFPLHLMYTQFEPDSAWFGDYRYTQLSVSFFQTSVFAYNKNSKLFLGEREKENSSQFKYCDYKPGVPLEYYWNCKSEGYSFFMDGEISQRIFRTQVKLSDFLEIQYSYRDFRFNTGNMDGFIEKFHHTFDFSHPGREWTRSNVFEIYVWDNERNQALYQITDTSTEYKRLSETLALKIGLWSWRNTAALALKLSSNFNDNYLVESIDEIEDDSDKKDYDFDDFNVSLLVSMKKTDWAFHVAISSTLISDPYFPKTPGQLYYYFLGANWSFSKNFSLIIQDLQYSSIFPYDPQEPILDDDLNEVTMGIRYTFLDSMTLETGFVEDLFVRHILANSARIDFTYFLNFSWKL